MSVFTVELLPYENEMLFLFYDRQVLTALLRCLFEVYLMHVQLSIHESSYDTLDIVDVVSYQLVQCVVLTFFLVEW